MCQKAIPVWREISPGHEGCVGVMCADCGALIFNARDKDFVDVFLPQKKLLRLPPLEMKMKR
jgi:hypothetical protein